MRSDRELLEDVLCLIDSGTRGGMAYDITREIRARLAEPEDEPVCWYDEDDCSIEMAFEWDEDEDHTIPLYRRPRQPVRLSDVEIMAIAENYSAPDRQDTAEIGLDGEPTGEFYPLTLWVFCSEELTAFARELLEKNQ